MTMIGIDPHKATHTAVAIDDNEHVLDEFKLRASSTQGDRLREWADGFERSDSGQSSLPTVSATSSRNSSSPPAKPCSTFRQCSHHASD